MTGPLVVLGGVIALIVFRQVTRWRIRIWQAMAAGAVAMLAIGAIGPVEALHAIDLDVMLFLTGMFVLGRALEDSGALAALSYRLFSRAGSADTLLVLLIAGAGVASAVLMNDTVAIVGVPVVLALAREHGLNPRLLLLALAFAVTAGGVISPIGNPQNLLVALAIEEREQPFAAFFAWLAVPTILALGLTYGVLRLAFRGELRGRRLAHATPEVTDATLARLSRAALALLLVLIATRVVLVMLPIEAELPLIVIALVPAAFVLALSPRRVMLARTIDWPTLAFFAALFIVVEAVDEAGVTSEVVAALGTHVDDTNMILVVGSLLSQLVSNVPLVALYLPALSEAGADTSAYMALAAGSTLAGNLTLIGAASNVIVVDVAERRAGVSIGFWEFMRLGLPLGLLQIAVTALFLALVPALAGLVGG